MPSRILVVEDSPDLLLAISESLKEEGYDVVAASTGAEAQEIVDTRVPELAVLDMQLPDTSGLDLCDMIKGAADIPVIMFSGVASQNSVVDVIRRGADDYILKGTGPEVLITRVAYHLKRRPVSESGGADTAAPRAARSSDMEKDADWILVADPDPSIRSALGTVLDRLEFKWFEAGTGKQALAEIRRYGTRVVLLELDMPDLTGIEILGQIVKVPAEQLVGVIVVTRRHSPEFRRRLGFFQTVDYIEKPWNAGKVDLILATALDKALRGTRRRLAKSA